MSALPTDPAGELALRLIDSLAPEAPPPCSCRIGGFDHSAECAVEVWKRGRPGPPIPSAFVLVHTDTHVLLGKRCGAVAPGLWGWPGGKADRPGTMSFNAAAELREETGLWVRPHELTLIEDSCDEWIGENGQSYPSLFFSLRLQPVQRSLIRVMEPHKHSEWSMFAADSLPSPMFPAEKRIIEAKFAV